MNHSKLIRFVVIGVFGVGVALAGCGEVEDETTARPSPVPATQAAETAAKTPTIYVTSEPASTATRVSETPTVTYTPSITPTFSTIPTSTVPLVEGGPWLIFKAAEDPREQSKLWAMNPDGTGLKKLIDEPIYGYGILPDQLLSDGLTIAYVTSTRVDGPYCIPCGLILKVVNILDGSVQASIPLLNAEIDADCDCGDISEGSAVAAACMGSPVWSPDHTKLAFVGAIDGPSADVYTYDLATGEITRLSDGPDHADVLSWSPDGRYVIHTAKSPIILQVPNVYGIWAARSDGTGNVPLFDDLPHSEDYDEKPILSIFEHVHSWPTPDSVLLVSQGGFGSSPHSNVRLVNLDTGEITYIRRCCFKDYAYDKSRNIWLFLVQDQDTEDTSARPYLVFWENGVERKVDIDIGLSCISWSSSRDAFYGYAYGGSMYEISIEGELELETTQIPDGLGMYPSLCLSPDGQWYCWTANSVPEDPMPGLWVAKAGESGDKPILVMDAFIDRVFWSPEGNTMYFVSYRKGEKFQRLYSLYRLNLPSLEPELIMGEYSEPRYFRWLP